MTAVVVLFVVCAAIILVLLAAWLRAEHEVRVVRKRLERMKEVQRFGRRSRDPLGRPGSG